MRSNCNMRDVCVVGSLRRSSPVVNAARAVRATVGLLRPNTTVQRSRLMRNHIFVLRSGFAKNPKILVRRVLFTGVTRGFMAAGRC